MLGQHLGHRIGQTHHSLRAKAGGATTADAAQLADDVLCPFKSTQRRRQTQNQTDETSQGLGQRSGVGAGLADVDEDLEGLLLALSIAVDSNVGRTYRGGFAIRGAGQHGMPRFGCFRDWRLQISLLLATLTCGLSNLLTF